MAVVGDVLRGIALIGELVASIFRSRKEAKKQNVPTAEDARVAAQKKWRDVRRNRFGK